MKPKIRSIRKYVTEVYVPELNSWVNSRRLKRTIKDLGYDTPKDWYDNNFLPRDEFGSIIYPKCKWSGCNNPAKFESPTEGYLGVCEEGGIDHHNKYIAENEDSWCHSEEAKKWRSDWMRLQMADKNSPVWLGRDEEWRKKQSELAKLKVASSNNRFGTAYLYPDSKFNSEEVREARTKRILACTGGGRYGTIIKFLSGKLLKLFTLRSKLEASYAAYLDRDESIESFEYEFIGIDYEYNGKTHTYYPDFKVVTTDGTTIVVEVKPDYLVTDDLVQAKMRALNKYIVDNDLDWNTIWITESDIKQLNKLHDYEKLSNGEYRSIA